MVRKFLWKGLMEEGEVINTRGGYTEFDGTEVSSDGNGTVRVRTSRHSRR